MQGPCGSREVAVARQGECVLDEPEFDQDTWSVSIPSAVFIGRLELHSVEGRTVLPRLLLPVRSHAFVSLAPGAQGTRDAPGPVLQPTPAGRPGHGASRFDALSMAPAVWSCREGRSRPGGNRCDQDHVRWSKELMKRARWDFVRLRRPLMARGLEIPTPRWTIHDAKLFGVKLPADVPASIQGRACTSPIWYTP